MERSKAGRAVFGWWNGAWWTVRRRACQRRAEAGEGGARKPAKAACGRKDERWRRTQTTVQKRGVESKPGRLGSCGRRRNKRRRRRGAAGEAAGDGGRHICMQACNARRRASQGVTRMAERRRDLLPSHRPLTANVSLAARVGVPSYPPSHRHGASREGDRAEGARLDRGGHVGAAHERRVLHRRGVRGTKCRLHGLQGREPGPEPLPGAGQGGHRVRR